jgi:hypothetical protein
MLRNPDRDWGRGKKKEATNGTGEASWIKGDSDDSGNHKDADTFKKAW